MRRPLPLLALVPLLVPAAAPAATVTVRPGPGFSGEVHYAATPGEANRVLLAYEGRSRTMTVSDSGATLTALGSCTSIDAHTAHCEWSQRGDRLGSTVVALGDGDDVLTTAGGAQYDVKADGGRGNDRLHAGPGHDELDGGNGADVLLGGAGLDTLADGDTDATAVADVLHGGEGNEDEVSYASRRGGLVIDLRAGRPSGAPGEGDAVRGVETVRGGDGADRLIGDARRNVLYGGGGDDVLRGGPGRPDFFSESLYGGPGDDRLDGGRDGDALLGGRGDDEHACGRATDTVFNPRMGEHLPRACEEVAFERPRAVVAFPGHPRAVRRQTAVFAVRCPILARLDYTVAGCLGTLTLREAGRLRRLIGRGLVQGERGEVAPPTRVRLTALGRRLAARARGVRVNATVAGRNLPRGTWTITLRAG